MMSKPMAGPGGKVAGVPKGKKLDGKCLIRVIKFFFKCYPVIAPLTALCILFSAGVSAMPSIFIQRVIAAIEKGEDILIEVDVNGAKEICQ